MRTLRVVVITITVSFILFDKVSTIDMNERIGLCIPGFDVNSSNYIHDNEGVWFPQYRSTHPDNHKYKCHTLYEKMEYDDGEHLLEVDSYYTKLNKTLKTPYTQSYKQEKRGVLVDNDEIPGYGPFRVKNYIIALNSDYRVRYICTDYKYSENEWPIIYIETRKLTPDLKIINRAISDIKAAGMKVTLDRIEHRGCTRPTDKHGYTNRGDDSE